MARKKSSERSGAKRPAPPAVSSTIDIAVRNAIAIVTLNRPEVHNAFNETLIAELTAAIATKACARSC